MRKAEEDGKDQRSKQNLHILGCQAQECGPGYKGSRKPRQDMKQGRKSPQEM